MPPLTLLPALVLALPAGFVHTAQTRRLDDSKAVAARAADVDELRTELASRDTQRLVRAVGQASAVGLRELVPDLIRVLGSTELPCIRARDPAVVGPLLDGLIVLDAHVPGSVLEPHFERHPGLALLLAARDPELHADGLARVATGVDGAESALALSLLFTVDSPRAAVCALRTIELPTRLLLRDGDARETAWDRDRTAPNLVRYVRSDAHTDARHVVYELTRELAPDATTLIAGPIGFAWRRFEFESAEDASIAMQDWPRESYARQSGALALADVLAPAGIPISTFDAAEPIRIGAAEIETAIPRLEAALEARRERWNELLREFHARGWIEFAMTQLPPTLTFEVWDQRDRRDDAAARITAEVRCFLADREQDVTLRARRVDADGDRSLRAALASDSPARVAWAAYAIGSVRADSLAPDVRGALARWERLGTEGDRRWAIGALFDALIANRTLVPETELIPWLDRGFDAQLVTLASFTPATMVEFYAAGARCKDSRDRQRAGWYACCNMLARVDPARFTQLALQALTIHLELHVVESFDDPIKLGVNVPWCPAGSKPGPPGYPPLAQYSFTFDPDAGEFDVAPGPASARTVRREGDRHPLVYDEVRGLGTAERYLLALLSHVAGQGEITYVLGEGLDMPLVWNDATTMVRDAADARSAVDYQWRKIVAGLSARALLSVEQASAPTPLSVFVCDEHIAEPHDVPWIDLR